MEIMRKSQAEGKLQRDFATVLQALDVNPDLRKEYEEVVDKFKAADEPQILALGREEAATGSTKHAPEEMHAMNAETGDAGCTRCEKFGKDECWTHSPFHCSVCDKRGKICQCVRKKQQLAQGKPWVRKTQRPGAKAQIAPLEAMVATLREELYDL
jgi:hypothetical protein